TLAELANSAGYATALVGKWHLGFSDDTRPNVQGFDYFFGHHAGCIDFYSHMFYWQSPHHHDLYRNLTEIHEEGAYFTYLIAREATRFIHDNKDGPFLLYVPFNAPHYPLQAPERFRNMYAHLPEKRRDYAPLVGAMDEAIGVVMNCLATHGLKDNTLVFFMSDNGISIEVRNNYGGGNSGGFRGYKGSLFEGGIRMPGIVSWPAQLPKGQTRDQIAIAMDVFPTVAAAINAPLPKDRVIDGVNWLPMLKDANAPTRETLFWAFRGQNAIRHGKWKLVQHGLTDLGKAKRAAAKGDDAVFLADIEADPAETTNLRAKHPDVANDLLAKHKTWQTSIEEDLKSRQ
ncbi:MAG: sulfatase-like hydrolase/transferase, partial [Alphaproteobacteria bacterium]